jgi:hypothetical protein
MFKPFIISSSAALLLIGCTTTATKPVSTDTSTTPVKVTPPAVRAVKPVLKPKAAIKLKASPAKSAPADSDAALGQQWASCAGDLEALRLFLTDTIQINPDLYKHPEFQASLTSYRQLPLVRDSLYAYAQTASDNPTSVATHYRQVHTQQYAQYRTDITPLLQAWKQTHYDPAAYPTWQSKYLKQVLKMVENWTNCADSLKREHNRFDSQITPHLRYAAVDALLKQATLSPAKHSQKPTNKRLHKAP